MNLLDICEGKHKGNPQSQAAFQSVRHSERHAQIIELLRVRPMTSKEIARALGVQLNTISGRFSELRKAFLVVPTGITREGAMELKIGVDSMPEG